MSNGFQNLLMQHYFPQAHPMMGGSQPPMQGGYNGSGINPGGMYTGGNLPAQGGMGGPMQPMQRPMQMGGNYPPQQMPHMGGNLPPMGYPHMGGTLPPHLFRPFQNRGFNFFGPGHP